MARCRVWRFVTRCRYDGRMRSRALSTEASCPGCGHDEARVRFDRREERIAITCTGCGRTDIRPLSLYRGWSEDVRAGDVVGVELRFVEPR